MRHEFSKKFTKSYHKLLKITQQKFDKQLKYLLRDIRYPSLRAKKYDEENHIWQARVDQNYRFYFIIKDDCYILLNIKSHSK